MRGGGTRGSGICGSGVRGRAFGQPARCSAGFGPIATSRHLIEIRTSSVSSVYRRGARRTRTDDQLVIENLGNEVLGDRLEIGIGSPSARVLGNHRAKGSAGAMPRRRRTRSRPQEAMPNFFSTSANRFS